MSLTIPTTKTKPIQTEFIKAENAWKIECGNRSSKVASVLCAIDYNDNDDDDNW